MNVTGRVKKLSKDIIVKHVHYVRKKIIEQDARYVLSGIDNDLDVYEKFFMEVLSEVLGVRIKPLEFEHSIVMECVMELDLLIEGHEYSATFSKHKKFVFDTCVMLFREVEKGVRDSGVLSV